jgi:hypothetical protein
MANLRHIVNRNIYYSVTFRFLGTRSYDFNKCEHMRVMFMHLYIYAHANLPYPQLFTEAKTNMFDRAKAFKGTMSCDF